MILIFIWAGISTAWSYVGRFGLVSLCHGAFVGIAAYTTALLFNLCHLTPWVGMLAGLIAVAIVAGVLGYACFRFGVTGHYFAITTLVVTELVALVIIALRDTLQTGGRLGLTINPMGTAPAYFQFESKTYFYFISLVVLLFALYLWRKIDQSKARKAMLAIGDNEVGASSVGISVVKYKTVVFVISGLVAGLGGVVYGQYMMYLNTVTTAGAMASLGIVFKVILGGMFTLWGPLIGTVLITSLEEYVRVVYGTAYVGWSMVGYGILIILLIIFMPKGVHGTLKAIVRKAIIRKA
jgi:branched-chain amino acid transport system permease protein